MCECADVVQTLAQFANEQISENTFYFPSHLNTHRCIERIVHGNSFIAKDKITILSVQLMGFIGSCNMNNFFLQGLILF